MNHFRVHHQIILAMAVTLCTAAVARADTLHVPAPFRTIQDCIDAAMDGDECVVADGTYTGVGNRDLDFGSKAITLRGQSGDPASCIVDCELAGRFASFGAGDTAVVENLTLRNGNSAVGGAALILNSASPSFHNCVFEANIANGDGGAISASDASIELVDTEFVGNEGNQGGAVLVDGGQITASGCTFSLNESRPGWGGGAVRAIGGALVICTNSLFVSNTSGSGGGGLLANDIDPASVISGCQFMDNHAASNGGGLNFTPAGGPDGAYVISECVFEGNVADGNGGGLLIRHGGTASNVQNCVFKANMAHIGGGATIAQMSSSTIVNCLFHQNKATGEVFTLGGAVSVGNSTPILINCTLVGNHSDDLGGGLGVMNNGHPELSGCVLWDNDAASGSEIQLGHPAFPVGTLTISYSDVGGGEAAVSVGEGSTLNWGAGNIDADPLFIDPDGPDGNPETPGDNDYHLSAGSPCIDAGDNTAVPMGATTDHDGDPRFQNDLDTPDTGNGDCPIVDMGSYEFPATCLADIDCDASVGVNDLLGLLAVWGPCPGCVADQDGDGVIGVGDLLAMLAAWGPCM